MGTKMLRVLMILVVLLIMTAPVFADLQIASNGTNLGVITKSNIKGCTTTRSGQTGTIDCTTQTSGTFTGAVTAATLNTSGNAGIGTTSLGAQLSVGSASQLTADSSGNIVTSGAYKETGSGSPNFLASNLGIATVTAGSALVVGTTGQASIDSSGNTATSGTLAAGATTITGALTASGNTGIGTLLPRSLLEVGTGKFNVLTGGNVGVGSINPGAAVDNFGGRFRSVGIGTTVPQQACIKADGTFGYFAGAFNGTCN